MTHGRTRPSRARGTRAGERGENTQLARHPSACARADGENAGNPRDLVDASPRPLWLAFGLSAVRGARGRQVRANARAPGTDRRTAPPARARVGGSACPHLNTDPGRRGLGCRRLRPPPLNGVERTSAVHAGRRRRARAAGRGGRRATSRAQRPDLSHGRDYLSGNCKSVEKSEGVTPCVAGICAFFWKIGVRPR